jgi:hypothetical protein
MSGNAEIGNVSVLEMQQRKRCREEDLNIPDISECPLVNAIHESSELKPLDSIVAYRLRGTPTHVVDVGKGVSDWVESQMRNISKSRALVQTHSDEECSPRKRAVPSEFVSEMTYEESLQRLEELQKLMEEDKVKLKPLQGQSDQCFNRLMSNEENRKHYIQWRERNGLEVREDLQSASLMHQPSILLLPSGKIAFSPTAAILDAFQVGGPMLASTMDRITPFSDMHFYTDELPSETDSLAKLAV